MTEKYRPSLIPVSAALEPVSVGVSPNPSSGLSWPMSYAQNSYERGSLTSATNKGAPPLPTSGLRYDPVRQTDIATHILNSQQSPRFSIDEAAQAPKRKREFGASPVNPYTSQHYPDDPAQKSEYREHQLLVKPSNSLQNSRRSHVCDHCGASFTRQHNLKSHLLTHTSSKKEFTCSQCGSEFRRLHDLKRHQKLHTGEKPFACDVCGRKFARADALGRHTKSSGEGGCVNARKSLGDASHKGDSPPDGQSHYDHHSRSISTSASTSAQVSPIDVLGGVGVQYRPPPDTVPSSYDAPRERMPSLPSIDTGFNFRQATPSTRSSDLLATTSSPSRSILPPLPPHSAQPSPSRIASDKSSYALPATSHHASSFTERPVTAGSSTAIPGATPSSFSPSMHGMTHAQQQQVSQDVHQDLVARHERLEREHREALDRLRRLEDQESAGS